MRVRFGGGWVAHSEDVLLLHEPRRHSGGLFPARQRPPGERAHIVRICVARIKLCDGSKTAPNGGSRALEVVRAAIMTVETPDGHGRLELAKFHAPTGTRRRTPGYPPWRIRSRRHRRRRR
jgi:hypothetical protein